MSWQPIAFRHATPKVELTIIPYSVDFGVRRRPNGSPLFPYSGDPPGTVRFHDLTIVNQTLSPVAVSLSTRGVGIPLGRTFLPYIPPAAPAGFRFAGMLDGETLVVDLLEPAELAFDGVIPRVHFGIPSRRVTPYALRGGVGLWYFVEDVFDTAVADPVEYRTAENFFWTVPRHTEWAVTIPERCYNSIRLGYVDRSESTLPAAIALDIGSRVIVDSLRTRPELLRLASARAFEELVASILTESGFKVTYTARSHDGGVDLFAVHAPGLSPTLHLVQCKKYLTRRVDVRLVRELFGVRASMGASKAVLVTTSDFTKPAIAFAAEHPWEISLVDYNALLALLETHSRGSQHTV